MKLPGFRLFSKEVVIFGQNLANQLYRQYPPELERSSSRQISVDRLTRILESTFADAQLFQIERKLGLFGKSRLCNAFKWRLIDHGYSETFIDVATEGLVVYLNKPRQPSQALDEARAKREKKQHRRAIPAVEAREPPATPTPLGQNYCREQPSPRYSAMVELYKEMHEQGEKFLGITAQDTFPGLSLAPQAARIKTLVERSQGKSMLDYGSGKGLQYQQKDFAIPGVNGLISSIQSYWGVDVIHCYDPCYEKFSVLPQGHFDGVISTDVLEHCPEEDIPWIIDEIFSFANSFVFANIACYPARKRLPNGENAHCTIRPVNWWKQIIEDVARKHPHIKYEIWIQWKDVSGQLVENPLRSQ